MNQFPLRSVVGALILVCASIGMAIASVTPPQTMRLDYLHTGNAESQHYALDRIVIEPLPWAGNPARPIDDSSRGNNKFEVIDSATGKVLYSRGFSTIFAEWRTTTEAATLDRGFQESLRFPAPDAPFTVRIHERDAGNTFVPVWNGCPAPALARLDVSYDLMNTRIQPK